MKKQFQLTAFILSICSILLQINTNAQSFVTAGVSETIFSPGSLTRSTGNDCLNNGNGVWEVSVWDDGANNQEGLAFSFNGSAGSIIPLNTTPAIDPDVVLVTDWNSIIHALVVYYDPTGQDYVLEVYDWTGSVFSFASANIIASRASFGTAVNIDADENGNFIIIFDEVSSNDLYGVAGNYTTGLNTGSDNLLSSTNTGVFPDVCIYGGGTDRVTYTYLSSNLQTLYVDGDDWNDIMNNTSSNNNILTDGTRQFMSNVFGYPRIACPSSSVGNSDHWTVVFMDYDNSTRWYINGYTYSASLNTIQLYNDNTAGSGVLPIFDQGVNFYPVVTYDFSGGIYVGWQFDNAAQPFGSVSATFPIVLKCDIDGLTISPYDFLEVPRSLLTNDVFEILSLAGRYGQDELMVTFSDLVRGDIDTKYVPGISSAGTLRLTENSQNLSIFNQESIIPPSTEIAIRLYDLSGKTIHLSRGSIASEKTKILDFLNGNETAVYILEGTIEGKLPVREKIITFGD